MRVQRAMIWSGGSNYGQCCFLVISGYNVAAQLVHLIQNANIAATVSAETGNVKVDITGNLGVGNSVSVNIWEF